MPTLKEYYHHRINWKLFNCIIDKLTEFEDDGYIVSIKIVNNSHKLIYTYLTYKIEVFNSSRVDSISIINNPNCNDIYFQCSLTKKLENGTSEFPNADDILNKLKHKKIFKENSECYTINDLGLLIKQINI